MYPSWWVVVILTLSFTHLGAVQLRHNTSSCSSCSVTRDEYAKIRLEQIKREILEKLGLDEPPKVHRPEGFPAIPQVAKYLKRQARNEFNSPMLADDPGHSSQKTERTILLAEKAPRIYDQNRHLAHFRFSSDLSSKSLQSAVLNVFVRRPTTLKADSLVVTLQFVVKEVLKDGKYGASIAERKRRVDIGKEEYVQIPLRVDDVQRWMDEDPIKGEFLGLYIQALYKGENLAVHPQYTSKNAMHLDLTSVDEHSRRKRSYNELCTKESNHPGCCLYSLVVNFAAVGWDFVIAPDVYDAHMCSGECQLHYVGRTAHSKLTSTTTGNEVGGCCHPTEYDSIVMIYINGEGQMKIKEVGGMIARRCSCA